ncbi:amidohydrolase [Anaerotignum sp.]|nr:amidohydrolase [Anaerotignum sp.]MBQ7757670.1 amidohydrolase [Anaerotignum sp.]
MEKNELFIYIEEQKNRIIERGRRFFDCPELGFKEFETMEMICAELDKMGVPYEKGIAMTGVKATIGKGNGYHIGFVADIDALPRKDGEGRIHSCGHSIQTAMGLNVLETLVKTNFLEETDGKVTFFFTPAEEFIDFAYRDNLIREGKLEFRSGKQNMIALGCFDGVDCILSAHASGDAATKFDVGSTLSGFMAKKAVFTGKSSHSGAAPHLGRNTLHGAMLCMQAVSFLKDQFAPEAGLKLNPVITKAGGDVNMIPAETIVETYVRANDNETLFEACRRFDQCVKHCAEALELGWEIKTTAGYLPLKQSDGLNEVIKENMLQFCEEKDIINGPVSGASGDVGDLGSLLPTVQFGFSGIEGRFHSDEFVIKDEGNCYIDAAKVMVGTIYDLLTQPEKQVRPENFPQKKEQYLSLLRQNQ